MARAKKSLSPAYRDEAVKMVLDGSRPTAQVARELGINEGTLGNWVAVFRREHPVAETPLSLSERARLRELEVENRELRMRAEFLGKVSMSARGLADTGVGMRILLRLPGPTSAPLDDVPREFRTAG
jgi:transposase